jgi:HEAT repeat protein
MRSSEKLLREVFVSVLAALLIAPAIIFAEGDFEQMSQGPESSDWEVRLSEIEKLEHKKDQDTIDLLMKIAGTRDEYWPIKVKAIRYLGESKDLKTVDLLLTIFNETFPNGECPSIKSSAALALGNFRDNPRVVDALLNGVNDRELLVREASIRSLGKVGSPTAVIPLIRLLDDPRFAVKLSAIKSLREIGDQRAIPYLQRIAENDTDAVVKDEAKAALDSLRQRAEYE